jgi:predicted dehydrogenase
MSPINIGFVGLSTKGWASMALAPSLLHPDVKDEYRLVALSTTNENTAKEASEKYTELFGSPVKPYHDVAQLINDPAVNLVAIAVKAPSHSSVALPAIKAGKDVFLEWPAGRNLEEAKTFAEAVKAQGTKMTIGLQGRHGAAFKKVDVLARPCNMPADPVEPSCLRSSNRASLVAFYRRQL